jgi:hypothetical protein
MSGYAQQTLRLLIRYGWLKCSSVLLVVTDHLIAAQAQQSSESAETELGTHFKGEDMAQQTTTRAKPEPSQPIVTVEDIDEALVYTSLNTRRDDNWHRWADALLDQRNRIARSGPRRETRVTHANEYPER